MIKKTYKIKGMDCASCAKMLELDLKDIGVTSACSYDTESLSVEFDQKKVDEDKILEIIKSSGFAAL